jgi:hypothetical protein
VPRVFHKPRSLDEFFAEAHRHHIKKLDAGMSRTLYIIKTSIAGSSEPIYSVRNYVTAADGKLIYGNQPRIMPVRIPLNNLPQCKASIEEFISMFDAAVRAGFITCIKINEHLDFRVHLKYPQVNAWLEDYKRQLESAIANRAKP